jgi:hypothetical protein
MAHLSNGERLKIETSREPSYLVCHIEVDLVARHCSLHIVEVGVVSIGNSEVEQAVGSYKQFAAEVVRILEVCKACQRRLSGRKSQRFLRVVVRLGLVLLWLSSVSSRITRWWITRHSCVNIADRRDKGVLFACLLALLGLFVCFLACSLGW